MQFDDIPEAIRAAAATKAAVTQAVNAAVGEAVTQAVADAAPVPKAMSQSLTVQFNAAIGVIAAAVPMIEQTLPALAAFIPGNIYGWLVAACTIGNALLRLRTSAPVTLFKGPAKG